MNDPLEKMTNEAYNDLIKSGFTVMESERDGMWGFLNGLIGKTMLASREEALDEALKGIEGCDGVNCETIAQRSGGEWLCSEKSRRKIQSNV